MVLIAASPLENGFSSLSETSHIGTEWFAEIGPALDCLEYPLAVSDVSWENTERLFLEIVRYIINSEGWMRLNFKWKSYTRWNSSREHLRNIHNYRSSGRNRIFARQKTEKPVTRSNSSCNLHCNSTLKRCKLVDECLIRQEYISNLWWKHVFANLTSTKSRIAFQVARKIASCDRALNISKFKLNLCNSRLLTDCYSQISSLATT